MSQSDSLLLAQVADTCSFRPVIGSNLVETESWRWTQWFLIFLTLLVSLWAVGMRETYEKVLIDRQQKAAGIDGDGNKGPSTSEKLKLLLTATLFRPWRMFFTEPIVGSFALLSGFDTAIYYALFAFFPYIYTKVYHFNLRSQDLTFLGLAVGNIVGFLCMVGLSRIAARRTMKAIKAGETPTSTPEMRLAPALLGSIFVPGGIFWMAWSSRSSVHFIMPIIGSAIFSFGNYLVFVCALAVMMLQRLRQNIR